MLLKNKEEFNLYQIYNYIKQTLRLIIQMLKQKDEFIKLIFI